jgi:hypothetical protein
MPSRDTLHLRVENGHTGQVTQVQASQKRPVGRPCQRCLDLDGGRVALALRFV